MQLTRTQFVGYLKNTDFRTLFIEEMGWNKVTTNFSSLPTFVIEETSFVIKAIAQRNGFQVLQCVVDELPSNTTCKKLDTKLRKAANDYICIFVVRDTEHHEWVAPVKTNEKRDIVIIEYAEAERAQFLYEKLSGLSFDIDEVTTIVDVKERVQGAFAINSEKITKDFYQGFNKQHKAFAEFISGIDDQTATKDNQNKQWYASVMLNRLMFCYFIQKKGFLDGDENYLRNKLCWVKEKRGDNQFFKSFYKGFLVQLFRGGLNSPKHDDNFEDVYGRIPYLNGGMFDVHQIEHDYENIDIKDEAFESLFAFFDKWRWHLDTRVTASGKDINPDVLGYIFEQYINDRAQMGAYYTKEDITEYIGRNTIVPYLMDATRKRDEKPFKPNGAVWQFLQQSGDRYIFEAVKKGAGLEIPKEIAIGIDTKQPNLLERRKHWNDRTPDSFALPTEIWRETIERLQRYDSLKTKIEKGEITEINDFITYNLDIRQFVNDLLNNTNDHLLVKHFYAELQKVTILDPTCGSGAFLFAALNILEPLYEVCISRMQEFHKQNSNLFKDELQEIENKYRSNIQYFIYKSIILRNLYGVDIMVEATEIAKLRLFLKMVAVVEVNKRAANLGLDPLPDIDFNIRCGNTLVGYATEAELERDLDYGDMFARLEFEEKVHTEMDKVAHTYNIFKDIQLNQKEDMASFKRAKGELKERLKTLNELLNHHLYTATVDSHMPYEKWLASHQPFHWLAEFYEIINDNGGFDVIIGNPPYVEYSKRNVNYSIDNYATLKCSNLYAFTFERSSLLSKNAALIVQLSAVGTESMRPLQSFLSKTYSTIYYGCFPERPKQLFDGACIALSIIICQKTNNQDVKFLGNGVNRTTEQGRQSLFQTLHFINIPQNCFLDGYMLYPKFKSKIELSIVAKLFKDSSIAKYTATQCSKESLSYRTAGGRYWKIVLNRPFSTISTSNKSKFVNDQISSYALVAVLNSNLMWWYYVNYFDLYNFKDYMIFNFRYSKDNNVNVLVDCGKRLMKSYETNKVVNKQFIKSKSCEAIFESFNPALSKPIIDEIDKVLAKHYAFSEEELDFIINYDIKYRMGDELGGEE